MRVKSVVEGRHVRRFAVILTVLVLAAVCLAGCTGGQGGAGQGGAGQGGGVQNPTGGDGGSSPVTGGEPSDQKTLDEEAREAYDAFLRRETKVRALAEFASDECALSDGGVMAEYDLTALENALKEELGGEIEASYRSLTDVGGDGVTELLIQTWQKEPYSINWVGIIKYEEGKLNMKYSFTYGDRTFGEVYENGYYVHGGSISAVAYVKTVSKFNGAIEKTDLYSIFTCGGTYVAEIANKMGKDGESLKAKYPDVMTSPEFEVYHFAEKDRHKIAVARWSQDAALKAQQEALIAELEQMGAEQISVEEMENLMNAAESEKEVTWETMS